MKYNYSDIAMSSDGDIIIGPDSDLYLVGGVDAVRQAIDFRVRTELNDMYLHPKLGTILKDMPGKRNTKELVAQGKSSIIDCLTYGNLINESDINIVSIPLDTNNIVYHIEIAIDSYFIYKFDLLCDLENGIRRI